MIRHRLLRNRTRGRRLVNNSFKQTSNSTEQHIHGGSERTDKQRAKSRHWNTEHTTGFIATGCGRRFRLAIEDRGIGAPDTFPSADDIEKMMLYVITQDQMGTKPKPKMGKGRKWRRVLTQNQTKEILPLCVTSRFDKSSGSIHQHYSERYRPVYPTPNSRIDCQSWSIKLCPNLVKALEISRQKVWKLLILNSSTST